MFRRTRYQHGSVEREERKKGPAVWVYRWWEEDINGKLVHRKAQVPAFGWNHAGGDGRTPAHNPRLLAAQQPSCHEQVPAGDIEDQALGTGQIGRRDFADGYFAEDKPNPMNAACERFRIGPFSSGAYRPLTSPDLLDVRVASA